MELLRNMESNAEYHSLTPVIDSAEQEVELSTPECYMLMIGDPSEQTSRMLRLPETSERSLIQPKKLKLEMKNLKTRRETLKPASNTTPLVRKQTGSELLDSFLSLSDKLEKEYTNRIKSLKYGAKSACLSHDDSILYFSAGLHLYSYCFSNSRYEQLSINNIDPILKISISASGEYLVALEGGQSIVRVYSLSQKVEVSTMSFQEHIVSILLSHVSDRVYILGQSGTLKGFDLFNTQEAIYEVCIGEPVSGAICLSYDDNYLFYSQHNSVFMMNLHDYQIYWSFYNSDADVRALKISLCGSYLFISSREKGLNIWDIKQRQLVRTLVSDEYPVKDFDFTSDRNYVFTVTYDAKVHVWDLVTYTEKMVLSITESYSKQILISKNLNNMILVAESDIKICMLQDKASIRSFELPKEMIFKLKPGKTDAEVYSITDKGSIGKWDLNTKSYTPIELDDSVNGFLVAKSGSEFIGSTDNGYLEFYDAETMIRTRSLRATDSVIQTFEVSKHHKYIATHGEESIIKIWNYETLQLLTEKTLQASLNNMKFSPDEEFILLSTDDDIVEIVRLSDFSTYRRFEVGSEVLSLDISKNSTFVAIGCIDKSLKLFSIESGVSLGVLRGHTAMVNSVIISPSSDYILSGSDDKSIKIWSVRDRQEICSIEIPGIIQDMYLSSNAMRIYIGSNGNLFTVDNPMGDAINIKVYPPQYSFLYLSYIKKLFEDSASYNSDMNQYIMMPYGYNILHIYAYFCKTEYIKLGIKDGARFIANKDNITPLSICMDSHRNLSSIQVIVKQLCKRSLLTNPYVLLMIERHIVELNKMSLPALGLLYQSAFPKYEKEGLINYGQVKYDTPYTLLSESPEIDPEEFLNIYDENTEIQALKEGKEGYDDKIVTFKLSKLRFYLSLGSYNSIQFMSSLADCENSEVFKTDLIKSILKYKWNGVRKIFMLQTSVYLLQLIFFTLYTFYYMKDRNIPLLSTLAIFNSLFLAYEIAQMSAGVLSHLQDAWNWLDIIRIVLVYIFCVTELSGIEIGYDIIVGSITLISWIRFVAYFRIFDRTRYLIRMIIEIGKDMVPFFFILAVATFAQAILYYIPAEKEGFASALKHMYRLAYGDFETDKYETWYQWSVFAISTITIPLVMFNLLITIMGDTYDRVQANLEVADSKELASLILDVESVLFWRRNVGSAKFIHECDESRDYESEAEQAWAGKITAIKQELKNLSSVSKRTEGRLDEIENKFSLLLTEIRSQFDKQESMRSQGFENIERAISKQSSTISAIQDRLNQ